MTMYMPRQAVELLKESQTALESARKRYAKEQAKPALEPLARIHVGKVRFGSQRRWGGYCG